MEYLVRVYCPEGTTVLDPFAGSSSTGVAAIQVGRGFIGIEMNEEYFEISKKRLREAEEKKSHERNNQKTS